MLVYGTISLIVKLKYGLLRRIILMMLFQRVKRVANELAGSETKLAAALGVQQRTLNGYLREQREDNLWGLLPAILEKYPQISRDWLYFGEGEMFGEGRGQKAAPTPHIDTKVLQEVVELLEEHLQAVKGKLNPKAKGVAIAQLYELVVEQEEQAREPIRMMRLVMGALAKVANE